MNAGKIFFGVVAGLAAGAAIGVLLAQGKDSKARNVINKKTDELVDAVNDKIDKKFKEIMDVVTERIKRTKGDKIADQQEAL